MSLENTISHDADLEGAKNRKRIWIVFVILAVLTGIEFIIAFTVERGTTRNLVFIFMTLIKAFYIVADFMHLKHETKSMILSIMLPLILAGWLILALLIEGNWYNGGWFRFMLG